MRVGVIGAGSWAVALAALLARKGHLLFWWVHKPGIAASLLSTGRHLDVFPEYEFNRAYLGYVGTDLERVYAEAEVLLLALPSAYVQSVLQLVSLPACPVFSATKGLIAGALCLPSAYLKQLGAPATATLSGPSHAEEVILRRPTWVALATREPVLSELGRQLFEEPTFRLLPTSYQEALEWVGVLKNVYAIGMGVASGWGDNAQAALAAVILREMYQVLQQVAPVPWEVFLSPGWAGDFLVTGYSVHSRNQRFGRLLAQGYAPELALQRLSGMVAEGYYAAKILPTLLPEAPPFLAHLIRVCTGQVPPQTLSEVVYRFIS